MGNSHNVDLSSAIQSDGGYSPTHSLPARSTSCSLVLTTPGWLEGKKTGVPLADEIGDCVPLRDEIAWNEIAGIDMLRLVILDGKLPTVNKIVR